MLDIVALFRPKQRSLKSLLKYDSITVGQFKGASEGQQKRPFPLAVWSYVCPHSHEYHCECVTLTSDEELTVTELQQK